MSYPLMNSFANRLKTFRKWDKQKFSVEKLAIAGFYAITDDCTKCYYCDKELEYWEPEDDPYEEHKRTSPNCPLLKLFPEPAYSVTVGQILSLEENRLIFLMEKKLEQKIKEIDEQTVKTIDEIKKYYNVYKHKKMIK